MGPIRPVYINPPFTILGHHTRGIVLPVRVVHRRRGAVRGHIRARDQRQGSGGDEGVLLGEEERRRKKFRKRGGLYTGNRL